MNQEKFKQDKLKLEKMRQETLRQEKLRQELENQELERRQAFKQEKQNQEKIKQKQIEQKKLKLEEAERLRVEKEYIEQLRLESERKSKEKIDKERVKQEQLMRERLERERIAREEKKLLVRTPKVVNENPKRNDITQEEKTSKHSIFGIAKKLRSPLKANEVTQKEIPTPVQPSPVKKRAKKKVEVVEQNIIKRPKISARTIQLCGNIDFKFYAENRDEVRYDPEEYVLTSILQYLDQARRSLEVIRLNFDSIVVVIDFSLNTIYCNLSPLSPEFDKFCREPSNPDIDVYQLNYDEVRGERRNSMKLGYSVNSFIWSATLLTAKGRLPIYTDTSRSVRIIEGADFSKLEKIPHMDEIVNELKVSPCVLADVSSRLNIPLKYVFSFYNAAFNLNYLEFDHNVKKKNPEKEGSGFLSHFKVK